MIGNSRLGVRYRASGKTAYQLSDHLGNVRAVVMENEGQALSLTNRADYYPFGMPMPNRQTTDGEYRYAYQGQEKDKETGKEAFELRLWDSRIGRWLTTDPYGEFASPYLGMGNNPISLIDPDGGQTSGCCGDDPVIRNEALSGVTVSAPALPRWIDNAVTTIAGWGDVFGRLQNWIAGNEAELREELNNRFANSFKNANGVNKARSFFYNELNSGRNLFDNPVTDYRGEFGVEGLINAGIDPYEQFVGSYSISEIRLTKEGDIYMIHYSLSNKTHFKSLLYHIPGIPSWNRNNFAPMSTVQQNIYFSERLDHSRLNNGTLRYINHNLGGNFK